MKQLLLALLILQAVCLFWGGYLFGYEDALQYAIERIGDGGSDADKT